MNMKMWGKQNMQSWEMCEPQSFVAGRWLIVWIGSYPWQQINQGWPRVTAPLNALLVGQITWSVQTPAGAHFITVSNQEQSRSLKDKTRGVELKKE